LPDRTNGRSNEADADNAHWPVDAAVAQDMEVVVSDHRQQEEAEEMLYFWSSLNALRGRLSAETFQKAEQELGFNIRSEHETDRTSLHQGKESIRAGSQMREQPPF
jgi:hypothetical protein